MEGSDSDEGNRYDKSERYNKGDEDRYKDNNEQTSTIKSSVNISKSISKIIKSQHSKHPKTREIYTNIISNCLILSAIAYDSNIEKIEIYFEKHKAVLKNKEENLEDAIVGPVSPLGFLMEYEAFENKALKRNRLKVAELYCEF
ncbi:hypothetical protein F8M41_014134 [Gigaspora margarita]|uniref:Uncharacterized protein n=1 Tax=Gigaspora margarita TaxID=4874 RepID=A0A8H4EP26_GIGMA|nr:hypothetical protein F8M41_014134 [Gigaspora margarita]